MPHPRLLLGRWLVARLLLGRWLVEEPEERQGPEPRSTVFTTVTVSRGMADGVPLRNDLVPVQAERPDQPRRMLVFGTCTDTFTTDGATRSNEVHDAKSIHR